MPLASLAFDPNDGAEPGKPARPAIIKRLPSTAVLIDPRPKLDFAPSNAPRQSPSENTAPEITAPPGAFLQPIPPAAAPLASSETPQFPPVDAAVAARAAQELQASAPLAPAPTVAPAPTPLPVPEASLPPEPAPLGFIAPAPLLAVAAPAPTPTQRPAENPVTQPISEASSAGQTPIRAATPTAQLSDSSRDVLSKFPSKLNSPVAKKKSPPVAIDRLSPAIKSIVTASPKLETYDTVGLSIKVQRPGLDTNYELNRAYTALNSGDSALAAETYKNILSSEPTNEDALFGLATTYHRLGQLDKARPYYAQLLKLNPNHREGLNNFLALVSAEAPEEALAELERLEQRNPDFAPIPAQVAALLSKSGYADQAREKMLRAIELEPENLTYKYNLAVMLDRQKNYADASAVYSVLIDAALKGQTIPAPLQTLQKRLNYISRLTEKPSNTGEAP